jgi:hypothetical protein
LKRRAAVTYRNQDGIFPADCEAAAPRLAPVSTNIKYERGNSIKFGRAKLKSARSSRGGVCVLACVGHCDGRKDVLSAPSSK